MSDLKYSCKQLVVQTYPRYSTTLFLSPTEMNVQLSDVLSDIVGETGLRIIEAIIAGERDPKQLGALCTSRIKASRETVANPSRANTRCGKSAAAGSLRRESLLGELRNDLLSS